MYPALNVFSCLLYVCFAVMTGTFGVGIRLCSVRTLTHERLLLLVQEVGRLERLGNEEDAAERIQNGDDTFNDI
jgi:hypothetical protein